MGDEIEIRRLTQADLCDRFDAGEGHEPLTRWFRQYAKQNVRRRHVAVWVATRATPIVAYVSVVPGAVVPERVSDRVKGLARTPAPVLLLARMATDHRSRGLGLGTRLVRHVFGQAELLARDFGCVGVAVDAKPGAVSFYERCGFTALPAEEQGGGVVATTPMFIPMEAVRTQLAASP